MRRIIGLVVFAAVLWGGYWFVASNAVKQAVTNAVEADPRISASDIRLAGFPNRFDTTFTEPSWSDPAFTWSAPFFQTFALSYKPTHLVMVWPETQDLTFAGNTISIAQEDLRASVVFEGLTALRLARTTMVGDALTVSIPGVADTTVGVLRAATRLSDDTGNRHQAAIAVEDIRLPATLATAVFGPTPPPGLIAQIDADLGLAFDAPLDRESIAALPAPQMTQIAVTSAKLSWGPLQLSADGTLDIDARGRPMGRINLVFEDWRAWFDALDVLGLIPAETAQTWRRAGELLAATSGSSDTLSAPLSFQNGFMSLGPLPLGPAPRFR